jgi:GH24 family phage-related lysozyme (muramidase)
MGDAMNRHHLFDQLVVDEGVKYVIYLDHLGYPTFGVGHLITPNDPEYHDELGTPVSEQRVWDAFQLDLDIAISECKMLYGDRTFDNFPGEVQEILVNMMFNMGRTRLSKFVRMNRALQLHDWKLAAIEGRDSLWYNQVTNRAERLMVRLENVKC